MAELVLIRHGQTRSNVESLLHGETNVELTPTGFRQAHRVAERLARMRRPRRLYSSPLLRAWKTAQIIGDRIGTYPIPQQDLREFNFGDFEGLTLAMIERDHPEIYGRILDFGDIDLTFPNGETRRDFHVRVRLAVERLIERHLRDRIVVVAHGGVIGSIVAQLTGADPNDWSRNQVANCSVTHLEIVDNRRVTVHAWNDVTHLDEDDRT